jgi:hypothetical protein
LDPFAAINALRKLLSFLPTKLGGCQYKMTPEEHRVSMHLLMIVEPFVGATPSRRNIARQPTEILDNVAFYVDSKRDLLSLALTCQRMHSVIFPRHFDYRVVKAKVSSIRVWNHLIIHRGLARHVRRLEILDERSLESEIVPSGITATDTDVESTDDELEIHVKQEKLLVSAVARMHSLQSFKWSCTHSLISIATLWPTLLKCPQLSLVDLNDNTMFLPLEDQDSSEDEGASSHIKKVPILREMTTVSVKSIKSSYGTTKHPQLSRITELLANCPSLQNLDITYTSPRGPGFSRPIADDFYLVGRWKDLTSLNLNNLWCTTQGLDCLATFLSAHDNIEVLHFDSTVASMNTLATLLPNNTLPRLKELKSSREFANAILSCNSDTPRPLETLKGVKLSGFEWDRTFFTNLARAGSKVSRVELAGWNEMEDLRKLLECVPKLSWLDVGNRGPYGPNLNKATNVYNANEWATMLSLVPEITTFYGVKLFQQVPILPVNEKEPILGVSDRSKVKKNEETASLLAWKCPKLRRLEHWEDGGSKVIVLLRDDGKVKYQVRRIKPENRNNLSTQ